jgi:hypothetical protein
MVEPSVCAIMLVNGRHAMCRRAIRSFASQEHREAWLLIYDTGEPKLELPDLPWDVRRRVVHVKAMAAATIGDLRNEAIECAGSIDIIAHWDSDDWSYPGRLRMQADMLSLYRHECVGYNMLPFWREEQREAWIYANTDPGYCVGTSMCYWRDVWMRRPFAALQTGEDTRWLSGVKSCGLALPASMIASIHSGNTSGAYAHLVGDEWRRAPEWDAYCGERMWLWS